MNRRGNIFDIFGIMVTVFGFALISVILVIFIHYVSVAFTGTSAQENMDFVDQQAPWTLDFISVMLLVTLPMVSMILAFFNNIPPIFFWGSIGVTMLAVILGSAFGDAWVSFYTSSISATANMPMTNLVMSNYGVYAFFSVLLISAGIFVKTSSLGRGI